MEAVALADYTAETDEELSFKKGTVIKVSLFVHALTNQRSDKRYFP